MKKKTILLVVLLLVGSLMLSSCGLFKKKYTLNFKLQKGDKLDYNLNIDNKVTMEMPQEKKDPAIPQEADIIMNSDLIQDVTNVDKEGIITINTTLQLNEVMLVVGDKKQKMPAEKQDMVYTIKMNKYGKVIDATFKTDSQSSQPLQKQMDQVAASFPEKPVGLGETWTKENKLDYPIPGQKPLELSYIINYTLKNIEKYKNEQCAVINVSGKFDEVFNEKNGKVKGFEFLISGNVDGNIYWSLEKGRLLKSESNINTSQTITVNPVRKSDKPQTINQGMKMSVKQELK